MKDKEYNKRLVIIIIFLILTTAIFEVLWLYEREQHKRDTESFIDIELQSCDTINSCIDLVNIQNYTIGLLTNKTSKEFNNLDCSALEKLKEESEE